MIKNILLIIGCGLLLFTIVPVVAYSQSLYYKAVDESCTLCVYCDWNCVVDGTCMHCGKEQ